ncbi:hypothetical protein DSO57_1014932 [Entomophthora muscae]|uniref:Uncharacterized protein n=1 Tax=Entomophthora muscae TaxID=34485 RepID=A0ACC2U337_9FUNG|nr:hypothetical protein DSO57_1014932 [Entomophthora muscae]
MKLLFLSSLIAAFAYPNGEASTLTSAEMIYSPASTPTISRFTKALKLNQSMVLAPKTKWLGQGGFEAYHQNPAPTNTNIFCIAEEALFHPAKRCFTVSHMSYDFDGASVVSEVKKCETETCSVTTSIAITRFTQKEAWTQISTQDATKMVSPLIPPNLMRSNSASSKTGVSFTFTGPAEAYIVFIPICLQIQGEFYFFRPKVLGKYEVKRDTYFSVPLTLQDGSLDGIYELVYKHPE